MKYFVMLVIVSSFLLACEDSTQPEVDKADDGSTAVVNTVTESGIRVPHTVGLNTYSITNQSEVDVLVFSKGREVVLKQNECLVLGESDFTQNDYDFKIMEVDGSGRSAHCNTIRTKCNPGNLKLLPLPWWKGGDFAVESTDFNDNPNCKTLPSTLNADLDKYR